MLKEKLNFGKNQAFFNRSSTKLGTRPRPIFNVAPQPMGPPPPPRPPMGPYANYSYSYYYPY